MKPSSSLAVGMLLAVSLFVFLSGQVEAAQPASNAIYYPPPGSWARKPASELGMNQELLDAAVAFAHTRESKREMDFSDQERTFGSMLGSVPDIRARTNGIVVYKGYVVASFGDTTWVDPTYSVAKSMLSTVTAIAVRDGRIRNLEEPVGMSIRDGGYGPPHNALVTWKMHLQQESEWQGTMFGKKDDFIGREAFGQGERQPREIKRPGTFYEYNDVRINRFALSLLRTFGESVPSVFRREVMDPIGASNTWRWVPYHNSFVEIDGRKLASVSGGTRWGGGMWIHAEDMARFGYLWLRGGKWGGKQILPPEFVKAALTPSQHGPDYGYLWWLNTQGKNYPALPASTYGARGAGSNTITILPEQDLVVVWRWHDGNEAEFVKRVVAAIGSGSRTRDCSHCPEMVVIPAGTAILGAAAEDKFRGPDELPERRFAVRRPFAVSRYEITRDQYEAFVRATNRPIGGDCLTDRRKRGDWQYDAATTFRDPGFEQADDHPVACVNWDEAQAYVAWLNTQTDGGYRLLTEAEWEYVARGGATQNLIYPWGNDPAQGCPFANIFDRTAMQTYGGLDTSGYKVFDPMDCADGLLNTSPAGSKKPNAFGVYDLIGNVAEWIEDCHGASRDQLSESGAPPPVQGECARRLIKGGSWGSLAHNVRIAERIPYPARHRDDSIGIRVARTLR